MMTYKIGVQLTPAEIQAVHRALTYFIQTGKEVYPDVQFKLLDELENVFKRIVVMEEM